jgi:ubiquinol-cytochrome c reductase cytochrome b subunit
LAALAAMHLLALHEHGSNNPLGISGNTDRLPFHPYFSFKDLVTIFLFLLTLSLIIFYVPNMLGQLWPYLIAVNALLMKCAICWKDSEFFNLSSLFYKTKFISYNLLGIIPNNTSIFLNYTKLVKYYSKESDPQITNLRLPPLKEEDEEVGISETLRAQKNFLFGP